MTSFEGSFGVFEKEYPFEYGKISAKRAKLFDRDDYERMQKMGPNELANFLRQNRYGAQIEELTPKFEGVRLVERAAENKFSEEVESLKRESSREIKNIIRLFVRRFDVENLKRFHRWTSSGSSESLEKVLSPQGNFNLDEVNGIENLSLEQLVNRLDLGMGAVDYVEFLRSYSEPEEALDEAYKKEIKSNTRTIRSIGFKKFLQMETEHKEIINLLRTKRYGIEFESETTSKVSEDISSMAFDDALDYVKKDKNLGAVEDLRDLERELEIKRLKHSVKLIQKDPLGTTPVYGYLMASFAESKNLKLIVNSKNLGEEKSVLDDLVMLE